MKCRDSAVLPAPAPFDVATLQAWNHTLAIVTVAGLFKATLSYDPTGFFGEETSKVDINTTAISTTGVTFSQSGSKFSGNNVLGTIVYNGSNIINNALASRPIKVGGVVKGFYCWIDKGTASTADAADEGWILSFDNSYFENNVAINSSSDRVDKALNGILGAQQSGITVSSVEVTEGTDTFAVFTVTNTNTGGGSTRSLNTVGVNFTDLTASVADFTSSAYLIEYSTNSGSSWSTTKPNSIAGGSSIQIRVGSIFDDTTVEAPEVFELALNVGTGAGIDLSGFATILDNDADSTPPVIQASQSFSYAENQVANAKVATVLATDNVAVTAFRFTGGQGPNQEISSDTYYQIDNNGNITLTAAGVAAGVAQNDFETTPNTFTYSIEAWDGTTWSSGVDITLNVTDVNEGVQASDISVNEKSAYAVFTITGIAGQKVSLELLNDSNSSTKDATLGTDTGTQLEVFNGTSWVNYAPNSFVDLINGQLLARVAIKNDGVYEGPEIFQLGITPLDGTTINATATILDDGTGAIYPDNTTGNPDPDAIKDDDRIVKVNDIAINENSPWGVFEVTGTAGQTLTLALLNDSDPLTANASLGSDTGTQLQVFNGTSWVNYSSSVKIPTGGKLLVRVAVTDDSTYEGPESFQLSATPTGGTTTYGTATILDDGTGAIFPDNNTGNPDPDALKDDDRLLSVSNVQVNENSPYAVFEVTWPGIAPTNLALELKNDSDLLTADARLGVDSGTQLQYFDGTGWVNYTAPIATISTPSLLVRVAINDDTTFEGPETFQLSAKPQGGTASLGTATINDDGTGAIFPDNTTGNPDSDALKDDDRAVKVNDITVNEGSPYAVFTINGTAGQTLTLALQNDNDPLSANARLGTDTGSRLEVLVNGNWVPYSSSAAIPSDGKLLVRVAINNDTTYEGPETFQLAATPTGGSTSYGTATINDDGSGAYFANNTTGNPDADAVLNDDRAVKVNDIEVNEASPYAVFKITGTGNQAVNLALQNDNDPLTADAILGTDTGNAGTNVPLQYFNGASWLNYNGGPVNLINGELLVRTKIDNDVVNPVYEGPETFQLAVTPTGGSTSYGTATILDDGSGAIFPDNNTGTPDQEAAKDDDRDVQINNIQVNERSPYAVFEVTGAPGQLLNLSLLNDNDPLTANATLGSDTGNQLEYFDGTNWQPYTTAVAIPASGTLLVRTTINNDSGYEGPETFQLSATPVGGTTSYGNATILDDGTGAIYPDNKLGTPDPDAIKDDDRIVKVNDIAINENSPWGVFEVTGTAGQTLTLALLNDSDPLTANASLGSDTGTQLQVFNGTSWVTYSSSVKIPTGGKLLVRVAVTDDSTYEGPESFQLSATPTGGTATYGTATILDDGTGNIFPNNTTGNPDPDATKDDDRAVKVNDIEVNEASPYAVFRITGSGTQEVSLDLQNDNDPLTADAILNSDTANASATADPPVPLQYYSGASWLDYNGGPVNLINGELLVRTKINNEVGTPFYEGPETFQLTATPTGGTTSYGTATILDDGTGDLFSANNTTGLPEAPGSNGLQANLDDDRSITVNNIAVNENSPYAVFKITWTGAQPNLGLTLQNDSNPLTANARLGTDTGLALEWYDGNNWNAYAGPSFTPTTSDPNEVLVRVALNDDVLHEGPETFQLAVTKDPETTPSTTYGIATILDNGFGDIFNAAGAVDPALVKDNDSLRLASHTDSGTIGDLSTANGLPQLQLIAPSGGATLSLKGANGTLLAANQYKVRKVTLNDQTDLSVYVIDLLDADTTKDGNQNFGTYYQGQATGNNVNTRDGFYTVLLNDNPVGTFEIKTNPLTNASRISCLNNLFSRNRSLALESTLYGHRTIKTAGTSGDDILTGLKGTSETLSGGNGNDLLNGVSDRLIPQSGGNGPFTFDPTTDSSTQIDTLTGGLGSDTFQLGDVAGAYYNSTKSQSTTNNDYAKITDFETVDNLLLYGRAEDYTLGNIANNNRDLLYKGDLIAQIKGSGIASLSLTDPSKVTYL